MVNHITVEDRETTGIIIMSVIGEMGEAIHEGDILLARGV